MDPRLDLLSAPPTDRDLPPLRGPGANPAPSVSVWSVMRRWRLMLVAAAVAAGIAGYAVTTGGTPTYQAKAVLLVGPINTDYQTVRAAGQLAQTYAQLATSQPLLNATAKRLGLTDVGGGISASANDVTRLLTVQVEDRDKARAVRIAGAHATELVALSKQRASTQASPGELQIVEPAQASVGTVGLGPVPIAVAAALVGFLGALGLALMLDRSTETVRDASDIANATGAGAIASISGRPLKTDSGPALVAKEPRSRKAEEFRRLAAKLRAVGERSVLVLEVDDQALAVAMNLAAALSTGGRHVAFLDAAEDPAAAMTLDIADNVSVHALSGEDGDDASARELIERLLVEADVVVVRAPTLDRSPVGLTWARVVDGTLLVASTDRTSRSALTSTVESLRLVHARLLGTVLTSGSRILGR
jgi:capsular polysaccharide biosynthesis protein